MTMWSLLALALVAGPVQTTPVNLIIDTDLGFDVDDVGAIAVGNHFQDAGLCKILGIVHNTAFYYGIGGVDVINHYYNRTDLELGAYDGAWGSSDFAQQSQNRYTSQIEKDYPSPVQNLKQVYDAVTGYTAMLNKAPDHSVAVASIGELTNLRDILIANKTLFAQKVKAVYYMDGAYNFGCGDSHGTGKSPWMGSTKDCDGAAQFVNQHMPHSVKQVYSGNGENIFTGGRFNGGCGQGPVKEAYQIWTNHGTRPSWDPITVYIAVMGDTSLYSTIQPGTNTVNEIGDESWDTSNTSNNMFKVYVDNNKLGDVTQILDNVLCAAPCRGGAGVGACSSYLLQSMKNCYDGHGATNLEHPPQSSAGTMTLSACQQLCSNTKGCKGVTVMNSDNNGLVECYRKANIQLSSCDGTFKFDTYTKNR